MQKKIIATFFSDPPPPFRLQNISPLLFTMNIMGQKAYKIIFTGKFVVIFFQGPLTRIQNLRVSPFYISSPLISVCERSPITEL